MFSALSKAIAQLSDPRFKKVLLMGIGGALASFALLWICSAWAITQVPWGSIPWIGSYLEEFEGTTDTVAAFAASGTIFALSIYLFPVVSTAITSLFLDSVCEAVEEKHYPSLGPARPQGMGEVIGQAIKFLAITIALNLAALPVYLFFLVFFGFGAILFYLVNGYLVGREFYELVAVRRLTAADARTLRREYRGRITLFGVLFVFMMTVPILNLIAPVLAAASMVHFFETLPNRGRYGDGITVRPEES